MASGKKKSIYGPAFFKSFNWIYIVLASFDLIAKYNPQLRLWLKLQPPTLADDIFILMGIIGILTGLALIARRRYLDQRPPSQKSVQRARRNYLNFLEGYVANRYQNAVALGKFIDLELKEGRSGISPLRFLHKNAGGDETIITSLDTVLAVKPFRALMLAAPGGGKTTTLFRYVQDFITRAAADEEEPLPLFVNLANWNKSKTKAKAFTRRGDDDQSDGYEETAVTFEKWLAQEIAATGDRNIPALVVLDWLANNEVCLFLDGLDEAEEAKRVELVNKLNEFLEARRDMSVMICSRIADYEALVILDACRLRVDQALTIQPYSPEQIADYLRQADCPELEVLLHQDEALMEMARSPLDLNIMVRSKSSLQQLMGRKNFSLSATRVALFDIYVQAMVDRSDRRNRNNELYPVSDLLNPAIPVPTKALVRAHRYYGWIAQTLCRLSQPGLSPNNLFNLLTHEKIDRKDTKRLNWQVALVLLVASLCLSTLLLSATYPFYLILGMSAAIFLFAYFIRINRNALSPWERAALMTGMFPITASLAALAYRTFWTTKGNQDPVPYIFVYLVATGLVGMWLSNLGSQNYDKKFPWRSAGFIVPVLAYLLPLLAGPLLPRHWLPACFLVYLVMVGTFIITLNRSNARGYRIKLVAVGWTVYMALAVTAGLFWQGPAKLEVLWIYQLLIAIIIVTIGTELANGLTGFVAAALIAMLISPLTSATVLLLVGLPLVVGAAFFNFYILKLGFQPFANMVVATKLKIGKHLPWRLDHFFRTGVEQLILTRNDNGFQFIHRRIRDYFAVRTFVPLLDNEDRKERRSVVELLLAFNDASCDVLLELINDDDAGVRHLCVSGLETIGTASACRGLAQVLRNTVGKLHAEAAEALKSIHDIAAVPTLVYLMQSYPVESDVFAYAIQALAKLHRLPSFEDTGKLEQFIARKEMRSHFDDSSESLEFELFRRTVISISIDQLEQLIESGRREETARHDIKKFLSSLDLQPLLTHPLTSIAVKSFDILFEAAPETYMGFLLSLERAGNTKLLTAICSQSELSSLIARKLKALLKEAGDQRHDIYLVLIMLGQKIPFRILRQLILSDLDFRKKTGLAALQRYRTKENTDGRGLSTIPLLFDPSALRFFRRDFGNLIASDEAPVRAAAAELLIKISYRGRRSQLMNFFQQRDNAAAFPHLLDQLVKYKPPGTVDMLLLLAGSADRSVSIAAICSLADFRARGIRSALIGYYAALPDERWPVILGALIQLNERSVLADIVSIFENNPAYQAFITFKLMKNRKLAELDLLTALVALQPAYDDILVRSLLSIHAHMQNNRRYSQQLLLHPSMFDFANRHLHNHFAAEPTVSLSELLEKTDSAFRAYFTNSAPAPGVEVTGEELRSSTSKALVSAVKHHRFEEDTWDSLRVILEHSEAYWKTLTEGYLTTGKWDNLAFAAELLATIPNKTKENYALLAALCALNIEAVEALLLSNFSNSDTFRAAMAMSIYRRRRRIANPELFLLYLDADDPELVGEAIAGLRWRKDNLLRSGLHTRLTTNTLFRRTLLYPADNAEVLALLDYEEAVTLCHAADTELCYYGLLALGYSGYNRSVPHLKAYLDNHTPVQIPVKDWMPKTLAEAAIFSLNKIGSFSAKEVMDARRPDSS